MYPLGIRRVFLEMLHPAVLRQEAGKSGSPSATFPIACVCPSIPGHSVQHRDTLCCDLPLCRGCRELIAGGDTPVHPEPTTRSLQLRCHQHRLSMQLWLLVVYPPPALYVPGRVCRPLHAEVGPHCWPAAHTSLRAPACTHRSRAAPPRHDPADPPASHETSLQQDAKKCL